MSAEFSHAEQLAFAPEVSARREPRAQPITSVHDVRDSPIGTAFGCAFGVSVACFKCGLPACEVMGDTGVRAAIHSFTLRISAKGEPRLYRGVVCR